MDSLNLWLRALFRRGFGAEGWASRASGRRDRVSRGEVTGELAWKRGDRAFFLLLEKKN